MCKTHNHYNNLDEYDITYDVKYEIDPSTIEYSFNGIDFYKEELIELLIGRFEAMKIKGK